MTERSAFEPRLEGMRGIAALIVVLHHSSSAFIREGEQLWFTLLSLSNPGASVQFFFVLSGYVLGLSIARNPHYPRYIVQRILRLAPMFIVASVFTYLCITLIRLEALPANVTPFFKAQFPAHQLADLARDLTLQSSAINGPAWSIRPELIGSLFLPVLVIAHLNTPAKYRPALFFIIATILAFTRYRYFLYFYSGFYLPAIIAEQLRLSRAACIIAMVFGYAVLTYNGAADWSKSIAIIPGSLAACLMIGAVIAKNDLFTWLASAPTMALGRLSYSLYLLHWPVFYLTILVAVYCGVSSIFVASLTTVFATLIISTGTYRWIESPAIKWGKELFASRSAKIMHARR